MPTPKRNWRLEIAAWLAAITLVAAALIFSSGSDETSRTPQTDPARTPADTVPVDTLPVRP